MKTESTVTLVIPFYNEASRGVGSETLEKRLEKLERELNESVVTNVVLVNDGSRDETSRILSNFIKWNDLDSTWHFVDNRINKGKGRALMDGFEVAKNLTPYIAYIDADLSVPISSLNQVASHCTPGTVFCGKRRYEKKQTLGRKIASLLSRLCNRFVIGVSVKDTQCPFKIFETKAYEKVKGYLKGYRWIFDIELLWEMEKSGVCLREVPVAFVNMDSVSLSTVKALIRCAGDAFDFKVNRLGKNKKR